jgi:ribonuclease HI
MDGACLKNRKEDTKCGSGIQFGPDDPRNRAIRVPGKDQSNQVGELMAIIVRIHNISHFCPVGIITDSKYVIEGLTKNLQNWEDCRWINVQNTQLFKRAEYLLKRWSVKTTLTWVKGHRGNIGNKESNWLAKEGAKKDIPDALDLSIPTEFNLQGAKLPTIDQATAYQGIVKKKSNPTRQSTQGNLLLTKATIE